VFNNDAHFKQFQHYKNWYVEVFKLLKGRAERNRRKQKVQWRLIWTNGLEEGVGRIETISIYMLFRVVAWRRFMQMILERCYSYPTQTPWDRITHLKRHGTMMRIGSRNSRQWLLRLFAIILFNFVTEWEAWIDVRTHSYTYVYDTRGCNVRGMDSGYRERWCTIVGRPVWFM